MAIIPIQYEDGQTVELPVAGSQTFAKGDATTTSSGFYATASGGQGTDVTHVALETAASTTEGDMVLFVRTPGVVFEADTDANPARANVGTYADLASKSTIDPDASSDDLFYIEDIVGAVTDNKVRGWFVHGAPNS